MVLTELSDGRTLDSAGGDLSHRLAAHCPWIIAPGLPRARRRVSQGRRCGKSRGSVPDLLQCARNLVGSWPRSQAVPDCARFVWPADIGALDPGILTNRPGGALTQPPTFRDAPFGRPLLSGGWDGAVGASELPTAAITGPRGDFGTSCPAARTGQLSPTRNGSDPLVRCP